MRAVVIQVVLPLFSYLGVSFIRFFFFGVVLFSWFSTFQKYSVLLWGVCNMKLDVLPFHWYKTVFFLNQHQSISSPVFIHDHCKH